MPQKKNNNNNPVKSDALHTPPPCQSERWGWERGSMTWDLKERSRVSCCHGDRVHCVGISARLVSGDAKTPPWWPSESGEARPLGWSFHLRLCDRRLVSPRTAGPLRQSPLPACLDGHVPAPRLTLWVALYGDHFYEVAWRSSGILPRGTRCSPSSEPYKGMAGPQGGSPAPTPEVTPEVAARPGQGASSARGTRMLRRRASTREAAGPRAPRAGCGAPGDRHGEAGCSGPVHPRPGHGDTSSRWRARPFREGGRASPLGLGSRDHGSH
jgi:hypothetical protein